MVKVSKICKFIFTKQCQEKKLKLFFKVKSESKKVETFTKEGKFRLRKISKTKTDSLKKF